MLLEVIVQSVHDAREATRGGADRLEVVSAIRDGGLTPPLETVRAMASETPLPLRVMVRQNAGYDTTRSEVIELRRAASAFAAAGVDGIVLGFARAGRLALREVERVLADAGSVRVTFHRAFDRLRDPLAALDALAGLPSIDRVLTSGGEGFPAERCRRLAEYARHAHGRIEILAGGGVDETMMAAIGRSRCVCEVHVGRAAREHADPDAAVSAARVRHLRELLDVLG